MCLWMVLKIQRCTQPWKMNEWVGSHQMHQIQKQSQKFVKWWSESVKLLQNWWWINCILTSIHIRFSMNICERQISVFSLFHTVLWMSWFFQDREVPTGHPWFGAVQPPPLFTWPYNSQLFLFPEIKSTLNGRTLQDWGHREEQSHQMKCSSFWHLLSNFQIESKSLLHSNEFTLKENRTMFIHFMCFCSYSINYSLYCLTTYKEFWKSIYFSMNIYTQSTEQSFFSHDTLFSRTQNCLICSQNIQR